MSCIGSLIPLRDCSIYVFKVANRNREETRKKWYLGGRGANEMAEPHFWSTNDFNRNKRVREG